LAGEHTVWKGREKKNRKREIRRKKEMSKMTSALCWLGLAGAAGSVLVRWTDLALGAVLLLAEILGAANVALRLVAVNLALGALSLRERGRKR